MYKIKDIRQTCMACPSQWSGTTTDNEEIYIRFRWGILSVRIEDKVIFEEQISKDSLDGVISLDKVLKHTKNILER